MGLLQPYRGTYVSASSAREKIDVESILNGCTAVDEEANHISEYANALDSCGAALNANALSVDGKTMQASIDECSTNINNVESFIMNTTAQIREYAEAIYNQIQEDMNNEARARDEVAYRERNGR